MVKFLIESNSSFSGKVPKIFVMEGGDNVINVPNRVIYSPEINADNPIIKRFVGKFKQLDCIEKDRSIRNIIRQYNNGFIADNEITLIKCLIAAEKIRMDALFHNDRINGIYREPYRVVFDMRELEIDTFNFDNKDVCEEYNLLSIGSILNFLNLYCGNLSVDVEITVCLNDFDYEILDHEYMLKESHVEEENITYVDFYDCQDCENCENYEVCMEKAKDMLNMMKLLKIENSEHEDSVCKVKHKEKTKKKKKGKK